MIGRFLLLTLFSGLMLPSAIAEENPLRLENGLDLLRACKILVEDTPLVSPEQGLVRTSLGAQCASYLNGMTDMNSLYQGLVLRDSLGPDTGFFCLPPDGAETEQLVRVMIKYLEGHPEDLHLGKRILVVEAFSGAFPCKGNSPKPGVP